MMPVHRFEVAFFVMTPLLLVFHAIEMLDSSKTLEKLLSYVPEDELENLNLGGNSLNRVVVRDLICLSTAVMMLFCHYNIEIQTKTLIIERHIISKQQNQLQ
jgi:hypothetical protein